MLKNGRTRGVQTWLRKTLQSKMA